MDSVMRHFGVKKVVSGEGIVAFNATPYPFHLNNKCLNQSGFRIFACFRFSSLIDLDQMHHNNVAGAFQCVCASRL